MTLNFERRGAAATESNSAIEMQGCIESGAIVRKPMILRPLAT